ncbi:Ig-like domain-containing protein [Flavobacterium sp. W1B]|uniref:Ig-like domain-containing protein n=1 Tax=Flavobacterium sp. W1B TaxID=3394146 RepID=UPI0039BD1832
MKTKNLLLTLAIVFIALISGCESDDFQETIGVCPVVTSETPLNGSINVPLDQVITATFNEDMDASTFTKTTFIVQGATTIDGNVSFSGKTATFTPTANLKANTTYTAIIKTAVKDLMGNALQTDYIWTFSTGATVRPSVILTDPLSNATNVAINKTVTANFNMLMNSATINSTTFTLKQGTTVVAGTVTDNGMTAFFDPTVNLAANTEYTATITIGAKNTQGTTLAADFVWKFTTGSSVAPKVVSTDPLNNASSVALNKKITADFSMLMDPSTINDTNFTLKNGTTTITGIVTYSGTIATFSPSSDLVTGTTYTATIKAGAKNLAGTPLANDYVWTFNTNAPIIGGAVINLGTAARFGILAGVGVSNNAGFSVINNLDVGISPGVRSSVTGFPPATIVGGAIYASDDIAPAGIAAMLTQAKLDLTNAYLFVEGASYSAPITVAGDQGGKTLVAGIYKSTSTLLVQNGDLTLSGSATDVWIFQVASAFTTVGGAGGNIILSGGAQAKNIYWQTGSSATIGNYTNFSGNILALQSITMGDHAKATGRMLARNGAVIMTHTNIISKP